MEENYSKGEWLTNYLRLVSANKCLTGSVVQGCSIKGGYPQQEQREKVVRGGNRREAHFYTDLLSTWYTAFRKDGMRHVNITTAAWIITIPPLWQCDLPSKSISPPKHVFPFFFQHPRASKTVWRASGRTGLLMRECTAQFYFVLSLTGWLQQHSHIICHFLRSLTQVSFFLLFLLAWTKLVCFFSWVLFSVLLF